MCASLLQSIDLAFATEQVGADEAYFRARLSQWYHVLTSDTLVMGERQ